MGASGEPGGDQGRRPAEEHQGRHGEADARRARQARVDPDGRGRAASQILTAEGDKQGAILRAEGERAAAILRAEGQARSIDQVFTAVHRNDLDPKVLAYQYLQTLPELARGQGNTFWVIPSEVTSALSGIAQAFGTGAPATADGGSRQATEPTGPRSTGRRGPGSTARARRRYGRTALRPITLRADAPSWIMPTNRDRPSLAPSGLAGPSLSHRPLPTPSQRKLGAVAAAVACRSPGDDVRAAHEGGSGDDAGQAAPLTARVAVSASGSAPLAVTPRSSPSVSRWPPTGSRRHRDRRGGRVLLDVA